MWDDGVKDVPITLNREVEAPVVIDPRLPQPTRGIELLGAQGGVPEVAQEIRELLSKEPLNLRRTVDQVSDERFAELGAHRLGQPSLRRQLS